MKLVKEHINEKFQKQSDPIQDMRIGYTETLKHFLKRIVLEDKKNKDLIRQFSVRKDDYQIKIFMRKLRSKRKTKKDYIEELLNNIGILDIFSKIELKSTSVSDYVYAYVKPEYKKFITNNMFNPGQYFDDYALLREKFEENSDPIHDIGIGIQQQVEKFVRSKFNSDIREISDPWYKMFICVDWGKPEFVEYLLSRYHYPKEIVMSYIEDNQMKKQPNAKVHELLTNYYMKLDEKFEEDSDPIHDMGIGIFSKRNFKEQYEFLDFLVKALPAILGTDKIPKDIVYNYDQSEIPLKYYSPIRNYFNKYGTTFRNVKINDRSEVFFWPNLLRTKLHKLGFKRTAEEDV